MIVKGQYGYQLADFGNLLLSYNAEKLGMGVSTVRSIARRLHDWKGKNVEDQDEQDTPIYQA